MDLFTNDFCRMEMHDCYVVLTINENVDFTLDKATILRQELSSKYKSKDFIMISNRKHKHSISFDIYKQGQLNNMKGLAIVSNCDDERDKALIEQQMYGKSFVFFSNLDEAKSWAEAFFPY